MSTAEDRTAPIAAAQRFAATVRDGVQRVMIGKSAAIELAIAALKDELENDDPEKIRSGIQNVTEAAMKLGEAIYKSQADDSAGDADPDGDDQSQNSASGDDDIVDADFEDLDDSKRA